MYVLRLPEVSVQDFFEKMLEGRHNNKKNNLLITRLSSIKTVLVDAEEEYKTLAEAKSLYTIEEKESINISDETVLTDNIPSFVSAAEMEKVYTNFFVDKPESNKIGRNVYDKILINTYFNLCPYCSHREVKTVDHYLPKAKFIPYAVTPVNLLPCCSDCNKDKLDKYSSLEHEMLIHPYYDNVNDIDWLGCIVNEDKWPITFSYNVLDINNDPTMTSRINYQFELLKLGELYADNAAREFNKRVKSLIREYNSNPENKALDFINDNLDSYCSENKNSWQTKMFYALQNSEWFLEVALPHIQKFYQK